MKKKNVLFVVTATARRAEGVADVIIAALVSCQAVIDPSRNVKVGSLIHFHQRLVFILYDTIARIEHNPESGIEFKYLRRLTCMLAL